MAKFILLAAYEKAALGRGPELGKFRVILRPEYVISIVPGPTIGCTVTMVDGTQYHLQDSQVNIFDQLEAALDG